MVRQARQAVRSGGQARRLRRRPEHGWRRAEIGTFLSIVLPVVSVLAVCSAAAVAGAPVRERETGERTARGGLAGQLLVARADMTDPRFARAVIYLVSHDSRGAMGLVVNRPVVEVPLARVLQELGLDTTGVAGNVRVHYGGPVERARGFVLHTADYAGPGTLRVDGAIALSWEPDIFRAIAAGRGPVRRLFALGYAGWGPGQLEAEINAGAWVTVPADEALVFDDDSAGKWERATSRQTIKL